MPHVIFNQSRRFKGVYYPQRKWCNKETGDIYAKGNATYNIKDGNVWFRSHEEWPFPPCATPQEMRQGFYGPKVLYKW